MWVKFWHKIVDHSGDSDCEFFYSFLRQDISDESLLEEARERVPDWISCNYEFKFGFERVDCPPRQYLFDEANLWAKKSREASEYSQFLFAKLAELDFK